MHKFKFSQILMHTYIIDITYYMREKKEKEKSLKSS